MSEAPNKIELQVLRCSACNKTFSAVPSSGKAKCKHCGEEYVHRKDGWHWAGIEELEK